MTNPRRSSSNALGKAKRDGSGREAIFRGNSDHSSEILVAQGGHLLGAIQIADKLRPEATAAVTKLKQMGLRVVLLTGDAESIANSVGAQLGSEEVYADLLLQDKVDRITKWIGEGLAQSGLILVFLSKHFCESPWITAEWTPLFQQQAG